MKKNTIEKIKKQLLIQKEELENKSYHQEVDQGSDEVDLIQANQIISVTSQLTSRDKEKLLQIEMALLKIKEKNYGACEECGEMIAEKRLEINPYFATCISCAEAKEILNKQKR